jgi:chromosome segregation ATPase
MNTERSLAEEITEGFDTLKRIRELEAYNAELKAYNTELHEIEHDLEMKVSKLQAEIAELKNARDYWCFQYKDVFNKLESIANERCEGK